MRGLIVTGFVILSLTACATQRYGRQTPVSPTEKQLLSCSDLKIEIAKSEYFLDDIQRQRSDTSAAHVLGFLGDFGIGNVIEGDAAEASGRTRLMELKALEVGKGCKATGGGEDGMVPSKTAPKSTISRLCQPGKMIYSGCGSRNLSRESTAKSYQQDRPTDRSGLRLTARQLKVLLVGNTETGTYLSKGKWIEYREYFRADGTIVGEENREPFSGKWSLEGDTICAEYEGEGADDDCFYYVTKASGRYEAYGMDGTLKARIRKVQKGKPQ